MAEVVMVKGGGGGVVVMVSGCHGDCACTGDKVEWVGTLWTRLTWSSEIIMLVFYLEQFSFFIIHNVSIHIIIWFSISESLNT